MKKISIYTLKSLRKLYELMFSIPVIEKPFCEQDPDKVSEIIYNKLIDNKPCMIARFGSTELTTLVNYIGVEKNERNISKYIKGEALPWWWNENIILQMQQWSGFFPPTEANIVQFCQLMQEDMKWIDVLGSWLGDEHYFASKLSNSVSVELELLSPYFSKDPWTKALAGKKVLVVHPFAEQIEYQYQRRKLLFANPDILTDFELSTIKAVQSLGGEDNGFQNWFSALNWMKAEMDKQDFDICLIGCGAYGFPLAAHAKRAGKKAVHMGGGLQLLFGIKGKRWENPNYNKDYNYAALMNEYWVRPGENLKPKNAENVEGACYW
jgi:hypothetical protein